MSGNDDTNRSNPGNRTDQKDKNLQESERAAERENKKAAEGDRDEKTPNPGHPI